MSDKEKLYIFDTTMRDGEQSPGASMSVEEKIQISRVFDEMGIDIVEAGFPIASPGDFEAVSEISKIMKNSIPCGLSRALKKDIDACHESLKHAPRFRIHTFISTSPLHMKHKLEMTNKQVLDAIKESVTYARNFTDDVEEMSLWSWVQPEYRFFVKDNNKKVVRIEIDPSKRMADVDQENNIFIVE